MLLILHALEKLPITTMKHRSASDFTLTILLVSHFKRYILGSTLSLHKNENLHQLWPISEKSGKPLTIIAKKKFFCFIFLLHSTHIFSMLYFTPFFPVFQINSIYVSQKELTLSFLRPVLHLEKFREEGSNLNLRSLKRYEFLKFSFCAPRP